MNPAHRWSKLAALILTPTVGETAVSKSSCNGRLISSVHRSHRGINGWIHWRHHHHNGWWRTLDRSRKNCGSIGHPYTLPTNTSIRTPEMRWYTLLKDNCGVGKTIQAQNMPRVGHKHSLSESIPTRIETNRLDHWHRRGIRLKKIKTDTLESLIGKLNNTSHVIPPERYFLNRLRHLLKRGKQWVPQRLQLWH